MKKISGPGPKKSHVRKLLFKKQKKPVKRTWKRVCAPNDTRIQALIERRKKEQAKRIRVNYNWSHIIMGPTYEPAPNTKAGGQASRVVLGPSNTSGLGSNSQSDKPPAILTARANLPAENNFISGHLVNADFGGAGESCNVVVLTTKANGDHKNYFESKVRILQYKLYKYYKAIADIGWCLQGSSDSNAWPLCLDVAVWVAGYYDHDDNNPKNAVCEQIPYGIICRCDLVGYASQSAGHEELVQGLESTSQREGTAGNAELARKIYNELVQGCKALADVEIPNEIFVNS